MTIKTLTTYLSQSDKRMMKNTKKGFVFIGLCICNDKVLTDVKCLNFITCRIREEVEFNKTNNFLIKTDKIKEVL